MLEAHAVTLAHGRTPVVLATSLAVGPGDIVALCGPNGVGKSTLLAALSGALAPRAGRVTLDGADVATTPPAALAELRAVLEQTPRLAAS